MAKIHDGMRVKVGAGRSSWIADLVAVDRALERDSEVQSEKEMIEKLGYVSLKGDMLIPAGAIGTVRALNVYKFWKKRERPFGIFKFYDIDVIKYADEDPPEPDDDVQSTDISEWWALELDDFPIDYNDKRKYIRGIGLRSMVDELPGYLEGLEGNGDN